MRWSRNLAYAIGLITSDGNLSKDGRHISICSKDLEQIENFKKAVNIKNKISRKSGAYVNNEKYYLCQFSNVQLYRFLISIGLMPNKSKKLNEIMVPNNYFIDFLRGLFDGDGYSHSYFDKRWKNSFLLYVGFISASEKFLLWLRNKIYDQYDLKGSIVVAGRTAHQLRFAKTASVKLIHQMYKGRDNVYLTRKKYKIDQSLGIIHIQNAGMSKLVDEHA